MWTDTLYPLETRTALLAALLSLASALPAIAAQPLVDAHLHYNAGFASQYPAEKIIDTLARNGISRAVVTSQPPLQVLQLHQVSPERIIPLLGLYEVTDDKRAWTQDSALPARVARMLRDGPWQGIGELHLFARERRSPVFLGIVEIAGRHDLPLLLHCDPAVIDSLYEHSPSTRVIWAHAGVYPYPALLHDYLDRYPNLSIDLSMRDALIAPDGALDPDWEHLLWEHPGRFMVGVDTYSATRWGEYDKTTTRIRHWLAQLPEEVAARIAYRNAERIFGSP